MNATTVDNFNANQLLRVAYAVDDSAALVGVDGTVLTTSITSGRMASEPSARPR